MKVLLDTNIVLDFFLEREPFVNEANTIWDASRTGAFEGYVSAITPINLFYVGRKAKNADDARQAVQKLLEDFEVCPINSEILRRASVSTIKDYEDAVQYESAVAIGIQIIVTRDLRDFKDANLPILSPADFLRTLPPTNNVTP